MIGSLIVIVIVLAIAWFIIVGNGGAGKKLVPIRQYAGQLGLKEELPSNNQLFSASGKLGGLKVSILIEFLLLGSIAASHQRRVETIVKAVPLTLKESTLVAKPWVDLPGFIHDVPKDSGKLTIGTPAFDKAYQVYTTDENEAKMALTEERVQELLAIPSVRELRLTEGTVAISLSGISPVKELATALRLVQSFHK